MVLRMQVPTTARREMETERWLPFASNAINSPLAFLRHGQNRLQKRRRIRGRRDKNFLQQSRWRNRFVEEFCVVADSHGQTSRLCPAREVPHSVRATLLQQ